MKIDYRFMTFFSKSGCLVILVACSINLGAVQTVGESPYALSRLGLKHRDHKGIGYDEGYSTVSLFLAPNHRPIATPFIDGRLHVFNDSYLAANLGVGFRVFDQARSYLFGMNAYYDYRNARDLISHQVGGGLEILSRNVDLRINGYKPIIGKYDDQDVLFSKFKGHHIFLKQKVTYALPMAEAELGFTLPDPFDQIGLYIAAGGYYLFKQKGFNKSAGNVPGGKVRLVASPTAFISFGAEYSYDNLFGSRANGFVALNVPLGAIKKQRRQENGKREVQWPCMLAQDVSRQEIIPFIKKTHQFIHKDAHGDPFKVFFVDNTNDKTLGSGTFEDPYALLSLASDHSNDHDIVYVFFGDGTSRGYDSGYQFKDYQRLISSAVDINVGEIPIKAQTPGHFPLIVAQDKPVISCVDVVGAELKGFRIEASQGDGVYVERSECEIAFNTIKANGAAIYLLANKGLIKIENNELEASYTGELQKGVITIEGSAQDLQAEYQLNHNTIIAKDGIHGIYLDQVFDEVFMKDSTLLATDPTGKGIWMVASAEQSRLGRYDYQNNQILTGFQEGIVVDIQEGAFAECHFEDNHLLSETLLTGIAYRNDSQSSDLLIKSNHIKSAQEGVLIEDKALESLISLEDNTFYCYSATPSILASLEGQSRISIQNNTMEYPKKLRGEFSAIDCQIQGESLAHHDIFIDSNYIETNSANEAIKVSNGSSKTLARSSCSVRVENNEIKTMSDEKGIYISNYSLEPLQLSMQDNLGSLGFHLFNEGKGVFYIDSQEEMTFKEKNNPAGFYEFKGDIDFSSTQEVKADVTL